ncbi:MAG: hypothetical protein J0L84_20020, partial [Verrucomicrobia bacterium]|nr:hypothetical protein [Verrucomicrobiota bacterium]
VREPVFLTAGKFPSDDLHRRTLLYHESPSVHEPHVTPSLGRMVVQKLGRSACIGVVGEARFAPPPGQYLTQEEMDRLERAPAGYAFDYFLR